MIFTNRIRSTLDGGLVWMLEAVPSAPDDHQDVKEEIFNCKMLIMQSMEVLRMLFTVTRMVWMVTMLIML